jgi:hypothetical protein
MYCFRSDSDRYSYLIHRGLLLVLDSLVSGCVKMNLANEVSPC